jgi:hypothetical protein
MIKAVERWVACIAFNMGMRPTVSLLAYRCSLTGSSERCALSCSEHLQVDRDAAEQHRLPMCTAVGCTSADAVEVRPIRQADVYVVWLGSARQMTTFKEAYAISVMLRGSHLTTLIAHRMVIAY